VLPGGVAQTILTFAAIVGAGAVLRATKILAEKDARPLNAVIVYVGLPAFVFRAVHGFEADPALAQVVLVAWLVFAVMLGLGLLGARLLRLDRPRAGAFVLAVALGNTGYIGYPVTQALLGPGAVSVAVFSDVFGTVVALVAVGLLVAQRFGSGQHARVNPVRELLTFPAVVALLAAIALSPVEVPVPVSNGLELLASMVAPLVMLSVGLTLRPRAISSGTGALAIVAGARLIVAPAMALVVGTLLLRGEPAALRVAVLEAGMPTMMLNAVVAERFGLDVEFVSAAIFVTTLASAATIPLVQALAF